MSHQKLENSSATMHNYTAKLLWLVAIFFSDVEKLYLVVIMSFRDIMHTKLVEQAVICSCVLRLLKIVDVSFVERGT